MPLLESPGAVWLLVTIPAIVLLWILRPLRPRLRVPSLFLWQGSPAERRSARPWQRLRNHPLLWIQLAIALLLALAAARPFLPADAAGQHLMVLLDASGSMRARDVPTDRFAAARSTVVDLARGLGPGQEMTVLRLDEQPRVLVAGARGADQVEQALSGERPSYGPPDVAAALALAAGLTRGPAEWVLVGDGGLTIPEGVHRPPDTGFRFLPVGSPAGNVAITGMAVRQEGENRVLQVGLRNYGGGPAVGRLQLLAEGQMVGAREWRLEAGAEDYVSWGHLLLGPVWYEARLSGVPQGSNALEQDDAAWVAAADASEEVRVLLVSAGNGFLERMLSVHGNVRAFSASPSDWPGVASQEAAYPLTVLDRLWPERWPSGSALVVGAPVGESFRPREVWPRTDHPLLRYVDWSEVRVGEARRATLGDDWETVIDSDGGPLLAVRTDGGRRQAVLTFELSQSDLPLRPAFPVLMANLMEWLLPRPETAPRTVAPGAALSPEPSPLAQQLWAEAGDGTRYDLAPPWPPRPFRPPEPGLYSVVQSWEGERQRSLLVASGYHPQEADLSPRSIDIPAAKGEVSAPARGALPFWPWLVAGVVGLALVEWWVDARGR